MTFSRRTQRGSSRISTSTTTKREFRDLKRRRKLTGKSKLICFPKWDNSRKWSDTQFATRLWRNTLSLETIRKRESLYSIRLSSSQSSITGKEIKTSWSSSRTKWRKGTLFKLTLGAMHWSPGKGDWCPWTNRHLRQWKTPKSLKSSKDSQTCWLKTLNSSFLDNTGPSWGTRGAHSLTLVSKPHKWIRHMRKKRKAMKPNKNEYSKLSYLKEILIKLTTRNNSNS